MRPTRTPSHSSRWIKEALELAHESNHHAEDLKRAFGTDHRISLVFRSQYELATLDVQALQRELVVDDGNDDVTLVRGDTLFNDDKIAVENAGVLHRIALHAHEDGR